MGSCEKGNEPSVSIKDGEFLEQLNDYQIQWKCSNPMELGTCSSWICSRVNHTVLNDVYELLWIQLCPLMRDFYLTTSWDGHVVQTRAVSILSFVLRFIEFLVRSWSYVTGVPVTTAGHVLGLRIEDNASRCGRQLRMYWISSRGQTTRGDTSARGLV
jgi:hypothetical protein